MNSHSNPIPPNNVFQNDISVADIFWKLWRRRGILVLLPVLCVIVAVIFLLASVVHTSSPTVFFVQLQGIDKSSYPNGTSFSPQDLMIPEVLTRAVVPLGIPVDDKLREAIQVEYGVPTTIGIQKKYKQKLAAKNLSTTDIDQINNEYMEELRRVSERGLRITIDHSSLGLSSEQGAVLANALPRAWSSIFSQKYRVLVDTRLNNVAIVEKTNSLKTTSEILSAKDTLRRISHGLEILGADNRLKAIVSKSGFNSADLESEIQRFKVLYFRPVFAGLFVNPDQTATSFLSETQLQIDEIDRNIKEIDRSIADIRTFRFQAAEPQRTEGGGAVQLSDNTLRQVIDLANQASLSDYLKKVLSERRDLVVRQASLLTELSRAKEKFKMSNDEKFWENAQESFSRLKEEYVSLLTKARQVSIDSYGNFYQPLGAPNTIKPTFPTNAKLVLILSFLLGEFVALFIALMWPESKS